MSAFLALSSSGCLPKSDPAEIENLKSKNVELENAIRMLTTQVRTLNEEHVALKKIVSDMGDSVIQQTDTIARVESQVKQIGEKPLRPMAPASAPRLAPAAKPVAKPAPLKAAATPLRKTVTKAAAKAVPKVAPKKPLPRRR